MIKGALAFLALATPAGAFDLGFPLACDLGTTCYIQQYVDHDPGPGAQDFTCGDQSYHDHNGTDFAVPTVAAMRAGVAVLAAADGKVKASRDGIADFAPVIAGKECGNGVVIDHGAGWETQYCHLRQGSITARNGDLVTQGTSLGLLGQSGLADFPHLHLSVRHKGREVDPFAPEQIATCGGTGPSLWQQPIAYVPAGLLDIGISDAVPQYSAIKQGLGSPDLPRIAPALVVWIYLFGADAGDALLFEITGPEGRVLTERSLLDKPQALAFRAVGKRLTAESWPTGRYRATAKMIRQGVEIGQKSIEITVEH